MGFLILVGLIVAIVYLMRRDRRMAPQQHGGHYRIPPYRGPRTDEALEILKRRYATGEIGQDEYEQKLRDLA